MLNFSLANLFCFKQNEREQYEVIVEDGKLVFRQSGVLLETTEGSKWIFVLSTSRNLYVGQKKKGLFQHSSFLAGGATTAAGRLIAHGGVLEVRVVKGFVKFYTQIFMIYACKLNCLQFIFQAIWPYSGHYLTIEENFTEFICFLEENKVDLTNVKVHT